MKSIEINAENIEQCLLVYAELLDYAQELSHELPVWCGEGTTETVATWNPWRRCKLAAGRRVLLLEAEGTNLLTWVPEEDASVLSMGRRAFPVQTWIRDRSKAPEVDL